MTDAKKRKAVQEQQLKVNARTYFVLKTYGQGGSGSVHQVLSPRRQIMAVKIIRTDQPGQHTASVRSEIALMEQMRGESNIIQLIDYEFQPKRILMVGLPWP